MLLEAKSVSRSFGAFVALSDASLALEQGDMVGLIGPNGAGKSTFFNCLAGDLAPTSGQVIFDGADITREAPEQHARRGIGRTFQVPATFEDMTILENVMVGAFLRHPHRNDAREVARQTIEFAGLKVLADQPAGSLSTPGRKRLEIARVLASEPRLILLDEALAGLTPVEVETAIELVRKIHQRGITLIIVEHIMEVIVSLASRVFVFNQGRTIASGRPRDVMNDPAVIEAYIGRRRDKKRRSNG